MVYFHKRLLVLVSGLSLLTTSLIAASKHAPSIPDFYNPCHKQCHFLARKKSLKCAGLHPRSDPNERRKYFKCLCDDYAEFEMEFMQCVEFGHGNFGACKYQDEILHREKQWCEHYP
ncbi:BZ3500_MvSof-1268-A1-R1_Chr11-3g03589 [Microbotryum saponariae]|uniref:BZ3500_MvSof-1268-A1-R1_Chr11-3g03589 protein n=1 Tax=Microbotryum saponariae TaxID=289078 RepID=A0A2X0L878_9BASI|nr:BZ3500_MvSof-1268-A1-R1_Chr11-3g03589 [Microbotryum saponariae]SDA03598.1 BZ3501_MvSof-1269-A2-R1_Chr11g03166 [Microbotryum saponariae]